MKIKSASFGRFIPDDVFEARRKREEELEDPLHKVEEALPRVPESLPGPEGKSLTFDLTLAWSCEMNTQYCQGGEL